MPKQTPFFWLSIFGVFIGSGRGVWRTATQSASYGDDAQYVIADAVGSPIFAMFDAKNSSKEGAVWVTNGGRALVAAGDQQLLYVAMASCVLKATNGGKKIETVAGKCTEPGQRDGPPLYARFMSLIAISESRGILGLLDSVGGRILTYDGWSVREILIMDDDSAFDLSIMSVVDDAIITTTTTLLLVLTPTSALVALNNEQQTSLGVVFNASSSSLKSCLLTLEKRVDYYYYYMAYILDADGSLWRVLLTVNNNHDDGNYYEDRKIDTLLMYRQTYQKNTLYTKLIAVKEKTLMGVVVIRAVDLQAGLFFDIITASDDNDNYSLHYNYTRENNCSSSAASPLLCEPGTYINPSPGPQNACIKCEPGFIAPLAGTVVCSSCNLTHRWQSATGTECLERCPPWQNDSTIGICRQCPEQQEGVFVYDKSSDTCRLCEKGSAEEEGPCAACSPSDKFVSVSGKCFARCPQPHTCYSRPSSINNECVKYSPQYIVFTVMDNVGGVVEAMAVVKSNKTLFFGNSGGTLTIKHADSAAITWLKDDLAINAMALSLDEQSLFIADTQRKTIVELSCSTTAMTILRSVKIAIAPSALCIIRVNAREKTFLYMVDAEKNQLVSVLTQDISSSPKVVWSSSSLQSILFITAHETQGVVCLLSNSEVWHVTNATNAVLLVSVANTYNNNSGRIQSWVSRWKRGTTTLCIGNAIVSFADYTPQHAVEVIAGSESEGGYWDDLAQKARFYAPPIAAAAEEDVILFLFQPHTFAIRAIYARPCECPAGSRMLNEACIPCPPHTYSMIGASECSVCPAGEFVDDYGDCIACPLWWWQKEKRGPCQRMQDAPFSLTSLTLFEAQDLANSYALAGRDIVSTAINSLVVVAYDGAWIRGDLLGRLWTVALRLTPAPYDPLHIAVQAYPGIWASCALSAAADRSSCSFLSLPSNNIQLGYSHRRSWDDHRREAAATSLFVVCMSSTTTNTTATIIIDNNYGGGGGPYYYNGNINNCFVGWPAQFNCTNPHYVWTLPSKEFAGGACLPCPAGSIAPLPSSMQCKAISETNPLCMAGNIKVLKKGGNYSGGEAQFSCEPCPSDTFSSYQGSIRCSPKQVLLCPPNFYIKDGGSIADNQCVPCLPCKEEDGLIMIPYAENPCPGSTKIQPYACVRWLRTIPGFFATVTFSSSESGEVSPMISYSQCPPEPTYAMWAAGAYNDICYFRCKFGINSDDVVKEYAWYFSTMVGSVASAKLWPREGNNNNLFPFDHRKLSQNPEAMEAANSLCLACDTSPCPPQMSRPFIGADGCGIACLIYPDLCKGRTDGCVAICDTVPKNAKLVSECKWRCNLGWIRVNGNECAACNASTLCKPNEMYAGNAICNPETPLSTVCIPCREEVEGGTLSPITSSTAAAAEGGQCSYNCLEHYYYPNPNPQLRNVVPCISCTNVAVRCPAGFRVTCAVEPCVPCHSSPTSGIDNNNNETGLPKDNYYYYWDLLQSGKATPVPTNDSVCRVKCKPGFHTISKVDYSVIVGGDAHDPQNILCEPCYNRPGLNCPELSCSPGFQILMFSQEEEICIPCKSSLEMGCPKGRYAPPCPGGRTSQMGVCLTCPMYDLLIAEAKDAGDNVPNVWPTRVFVDHHYNNHQTDAVLSTTNANNYCPVACVDGSVQVRKSANVFACVACSELLPRPPSNSPYKTYYATWNATQGSRWWPAEFDPPHLPARPYFSTEEKRAGLCWPCPSSSSSLSSLTIKEGDPCFYFTNNNGDGDNNNNGDDGQQQQVAEDGNHNVIIGVVDQPLSFAWVNSRRRRRLLSSSSLAACEKGQYLVKRYTVKWCATCPKNYYCPPLENEPVRCKAFSNSEAGSTSAADCVCRKGFTSAAYDYSSVCTPTIKKRAREGGFRMCPRGYFAVTTTTTTTTTKRCLACAAGKFEADGDCRECPFPLSSVPGATSCSLSPDYADATSDKQKAQCARVNAILGGWPPTCICRPGTTVDAEGSRCEPCPKGTFSTYAGLAPCIPCPTGSSTTSEGATSLTQCLWPPRTRKKTSFIF